jgi:hypothetical protein
LKNLFYASHPSVEHWASFPWHKTKYGGWDTDVPHSSQALAIDYFRTMKVIAQEARDAAFEQIASSIGLPASGPWQIELEWQDPSNLLCESKRYPTQVDAVAISPLAMIFFEAKFNERDGGHCSQTEKTKEGHIQCNGNYELQENPVNKSRNACALSGKGIRYWEVIPQIANLDASASYTTCPFAESGYQWMRNVAVAHERSAFEDKQAGVVIAYADHAGLRFPRVLHSEGWTGFTSILKQQRIKLSTMTYQRLCRIAVESNPSVKMLAELEAWIIQKINWVGSKQKPL